MLPDARCQSSRGPEPDLVVDSHPQLLFFKDGGRCAIPCSACWRRSVERWSRKLRWICTCFLRNICGPCAAGRRGMRDVRVLLLTAGVPYGTLLAAIGFPSVLRWWDR